MHCRLILFFVLLTGSNIINLKKAIINHEEKILDVEDSGDYSIIQEIIVLKEPFDKLWEMVLQLFESHEKWTNGSILELNAEEIEQEVSCH